MADFSSNLKRIRKRENLSQELLAEKLMVTRQTISNWERGVSHS
ncbi:MAG: helix-turn-helix transcriptional regulator [Oscillospiraceae bacterium]